MIGNAFSVAFPENTLNVMCFAHVMANLKKRKLNDKTNWPKIKNDVKQLQLAPTNKYFSNAVKFFIEKYEESEPDFCDYFAQEWVSKNKFWFEGARHYTPSTNNCVEAFNSVLKRDYTHRKRASLAAFKVNLKNIVQSLSVKYETGEKLFCSKVEISTDDWRAGVEWVKLERKKIRIQTAKPNIMKIYVPSRQFNETYAGEEFSNHYVNMYTQMKCDNFDQFKNVAFSMYMLTFNTDNWKKVLALAHNSLKNISVSMFWVWLSMTNYRYHQKKQTQILLGQKIRRAVSHTRKRPC